jgi:hypothetical protein
MRRPSLRRASTFFMIIAAAALASACQVGDIGSSTGDSTGEGDDDDDDPIECEGPLGAPRDPATLPACCDAYGSAHCLPADTVPEELHDFMAACDGDSFCVPDKFIETGGVYTPLACTSLSGAAGVCLSGCIPDVDEFFALLPQDVCDTDERCAPCVNPLDGTETGGCDIAFACGDDPFGGGGDGDGDPVAACPHEGPPVIDPATLPSCQQCGGAHCLANALVPEGFADRLGDCDATAKCVPDEFIETAGNFVPPTCESVAGAEGRCLSTCLPEVQAQAALLPQSSCAADHLCVPCFSPLDGADTGACRLSCDPGPTEGPTQLPICCDGRGTCVPAAAAGDDADKLGEDECPEDAGLLCAPDVFLEGMFVPQACETGLIAVLFGDEFAEGRCLPDCLPDVDNFLIGQDDCEDGFKCAPCLDPLSGEASGACEL